MDFVKENFTPKFKYYDLQDLVTDAHVVVGRLELGEIWDTWHPANFPYLVRDRSDGWTIMNINMIVFDFRRVVGFLVTFFEISPFSNVLVTGSAPHLVKMGRADFVIQVLSEYSDFFYIRWLSGTFTNRRVIYSYWKRGKFRRLQNTLEREWRKIMFEVVLKIRWLPDLLFALSLTDEFRPMADEVRILKIPTIGVVDSDANPYGISYPVRSNDDRFLSLEFYLFLFFKCRDYGLEIARNKFFQMFDSSRYLIKKKLNIFKWFKVVYKLINRNFMASLFKKKKKIFKKPLKNKVELEFDKIKEVRRFFSEAINRFMQTILRAESANIRYKQLVEEINYSKYKLALPGNFYYTAYNNIFFFTVNYSFGDYLYNLAIKK